MKKIKVIFISLLFLFIFTGMISLNNIYGVSSTISGGNVNQGNQITVKVSFSGDVCAANFNLSYDKSKLELVSGDPNFAWVEGENLPVYTFKAKSDATGNASISLSGQASDTSYIKYPLTGNGNINITAKQNESSNSNVNSNTKNNNTTAVNKSVNKSTSTQKVVRGNSDEVVIFEGEMTSNKGKVAVTDLVVTGTASKALLTSEQITITLYVDGSSFSDATLKATD